MHNARMIYLCLLLAALCFCTNADEQALLTLINRLNSDVIELRNEVELHHSKRCDAILGCTQASYDECLSELSSGQSCPSKDQLGYAVDECGLGENCNGLFDFTSTTVRLPNGTVVDPNGDRTPKNPIVSVCFDAAQFSINNLSIFLILCYFVTPIDYRSNLLF